MQMPSDAVTEPRTDPTVDALVPRPRWWRPVVAALVIALALVAAWFSPVVLRPTLMSSGGWTTSHDQTDQVLTTHWVEAHGIPAVTVREVRPVPGTEVLGAWLLHAEPGADGPPVGELPDARSTLEALVPPAVLNSATLPARVDNGATAWLVVAWQVTDCQSLADAVAAGGLLEDEPYVRISTPLTPQRSGATAVTMLLQPTLLDEGRICGDWAD